MATKKAAPSKPAAQRTLAPVVEEITIEQARRILGKRGFNRMIQVSRDPATGRIIDLILREA
jgi:hypothetical protein